MASDESAEPSYGSSDECEPTDEQYALMEFAYRLGSWHVSDSGAGIADEGQTRQEAKLLMMLLASPPRMDENDLEPISSSESEQSITSDSSYSRRDNFSFICPSLSLERSESPSAAKTVARRLFDSVASPSLSSESTEMPVPATLLRRPLKVDDRNAMRLSADAMARNIQESFLKALEWRVHAWIHALSKSLVEKEREMQKAGASEEEIKCLLESSEARLIVQLREVGGTIKVAATGTSFQILTHAVAKEDSHAEEPAYKKLRIQEGSDLEDEGTLYEVAYPLMMDCLFCLQTPAGTSEMILHVPGTMKGTFFTSETGSEELRSVVVDIDTEMLAAMVEKGCRAVIRAVVESLTCNHGDEEEPDEHEEAHTAAEVDFTTPSPTNHHPMVTPNEVRAALVTPRALFSGQSHDYDGMASPQPVLMPIPDDFDDKRAPRRISPQPHVTSDDYGAFTPRTPHRISRRPSPPLISPALNEASYHDVAENGPSLPMLVEVACRAFQDK